MTLSLSETSSSLSAPDVGQLQALFRGWRDNEEDEGVFHRTGLSC
jgi:hypothetical protein